MKKLALAAFLLGMLGLLTAVNTAVAADKDDPTGTWKIKSKFGEKEIERTLKLENKDGKVTGTVSGFGKNAKDTSIEDGKFKDGELTFTVTRVGGKDKDQKIVSKYSAKVSGDTIKGTITTDFNGKENKTDFEGKKEAKKD
ncbi:MAG: hypothetical protein J0I06_28225 [Planctomycetes bacterium]|nr:hypothetical protein [Planctomycetota bacterium]